MTDLKCEMEEISLSDEPQVLGRSVNDKSRNCPSKTEPQLPALSISASITDLQKHRSGTVCLRHTLHIGVKLIGIGGMLSVLLMATTGFPAGLVHNESIRNRTMSLLFFLGLLMVALEDFTEVNKSAVVLLLAATLWTMLAVGFDGSRAEAGAHQFHHELDRGLRDVGSVILFLLPAMGVVESIDHFGGFQIVTVGIRKAMVGRKERLTPIICILTFLLSSIIDNLTSTIVAIKILRNIAPKDDEWRKLLGGLAVIAANAGGAWSPIGDVTTTMLWIQGKITAPRIMLGLFVPSVVTGLFPLAAVYLGILKCTPSEKKTDDQAGSRPESPVGKQAHAREAGGDRSGADEDVDEESLALEKQPLRPELGSLDEELTRSKVLSLTIGVLVILLVPVLKMMVGLPPYLGMLLALGLMWLASDLLHLDDSSPVDQKEDDHSVTRHGVIAALYKVDLSGLLFFTGILLSVGALDSAGVLHAFAKMLVDALGQSPVALCTLLGISSAVVDNVPLVEASIDMFKDVQTDDKLWQLIALAAGTGGSILSVGSIAGVTLMSMEGVSFLWYCRRISIWAFFGFISGIGVYQLQSAITGW